MARRAETLLLALSGAFVAVNSLALALLRGFSLDGLFVALAWFLAAGLGRAWLDRLLPERDPLLFPLTLFMTALGLLMIARLAPTFASRQALWLIVSCVALLTTASVPQLLRRLARYRYLLLIFGLALLIATILMGRNPSGLSGAPELWLGIGGLFFQPSEALKIILVAFLASYLAEQAQVSAFNHSMKTERLWLNPRLAGPLALMWSLSTLVLVWQRDLGTASLFFLVFMVLLYVASGRSAVVLMGLLLTVLAMVIAYQLFDVVRLRVDIWMSPWEEASGRAYQIVQSLMAFAAGSVGGQGVGQGLPNAIPVVHSDFVFAAVAEEWGLLGVVALIGALLAWVLRGLKIALRHHERPYYALLAVGLTSLVALQSLLIMGGVLKILPLTGVTLPFVSYGGSSLLVSFVIVGMLLRLSIEER
ncbi:MAG: FtsW/RodA/SpoVE family cell cycle protein [Anaerolineae bacterium]|nr:FtsW/RodA/SpoVE family cell cycle protein [Anaerolineae bacterium]MDW8173181.1 FtsW/RodA/SpoVE family cell cycle protein [Anaerolineae bacterium]